MFQSLASRDTIQSARNCAVDRQFKKKLAVLSADSEAAKASLGRMTVGIRSALRKLECGSDEGAIDSTDDDLDEGL